MKELMQATYSGVDPDALSALLKSNKEFASHITSIKKADAFYTTTTTGIYDAVYGAKAWIAINQEAGAFGVLPKKPYISGGYRVLINFANAAGIAEDANLPDAVKNDYAKVKVGLKTITAVHKYSEILSLTEGKDDVLAHAEEVTNDGLAFNKSINKQLTTTVDTPAVINLESLHRVNSGFTEKGLVSAGTDVDIYGIDRHTAASIYDAQVITGATPGTAEALSLAKLENAIASCQPYWANPNDISKKVFLTGFDTAMRIAQLLESYQMINPTIKVKLSVNGIETFNGIEGGMYVASYMGIPIIATNDLPKSGTGANLTDILLIDTENTFIQVAKPTIYYESKDPINNKFFGEVGVYQFVGEVVCTNFRANAKIRDLKTA